ncbi:MAG: shikimate dehydrogenase [Anaerolineae bacterium]
MNPRDSQPFPALTGRTRVVGVIGWPVAHSLSPAMHNAAFRALGLDWCYVPLPVAPGGLSAAIAGVRALGLQGINATVPHKEALLALVDERTSEAQAIGAVNTVLVRGQRLVGHNTDAAGFLRSLREVGFEPRGCRALILGAGGAARAVVYALAAEGAEVTLVNRHVERAHLLAEAFRSLPGRIVAGPWQTDYLAQATPGVELIVNTTPLGMWPEVDVNPWSDEVALPVGVLWYDLVYNPRETRFLREAREAGARGLDGLPMLVHQGAEAFALWTGVKPPLDVMWAACLAALEGS